MVFPKLPHVERPALVLQLLHVSECVPESYGHRGRPAKREKFSESESVVEVAVVPLAFDV